MYRHGAVPTRPQGCPAAHQRDHLAPRPYNRKVFELQARAHRPHSAHTPADPRAAAPRSAAWRPRWVGPPPDMAAEKRGRARQRQGLGASPSPCTGLCPSPIFLLAQHAKVLPQPARGNLHGPASTAAAAAGVPRRRRARVLTTAPSPATAPAGAPAALLRALRVRHLHLPCRLTGPPHSVQQRQEVRVVGAAQGNHDRPLHCRPQLRQRQGGGRGRAGWCKRAGAHK